MTKEQEIYRNMKRRHRIYKAYGKWGISFPSLYVSIKEAGYTDDTTIRKIIDRMENKGYIRRGRELHGCALHYTSKYVIIKWVN